MAIVSRVCLMISGVCVLSLLLLGFALLAGLHNGLDVKPLADHMVMVCGVAAVLLVVGIGMLPLGGRK